MGYLHLLKTRIESIWPGGRQIAEAIDMLGGYSERLRGGDVQGIHEMSATQNYRLGATLKKPDGRVFKYARATATLNTDLGADNYQQQHVAYNTIAANANPLTTTVIIDVANTDGDGSGNIAIDEMVGGYIVIFPHSANSINRRILANSAVSGGGEMELLLDDPIPVALVEDSTHGECMASPYYDIRTTTDPAKTKVGVPAVPATAAIPYHWLQTWGPIWVAPHGTVGDENHDIQVVWRYAGSVMEHLYSDAYATKQQHAGHVLTQAIGGGQGAPFMILQITQ